MNYEAARINMVDGQIHPSGVINPALLHAFETVPREIFVPENVQAMAYSDEEISLGQKRVLMEPLILSRMLQEINPQPDDVVLDIGGATGYSATILSPLVSTIVALEENQEFIKQAEKNWNTLDACNIVSVHKPLKDGYADQAPFDIILINGAVSEIPENICQQLAPGGKLIAVVKKPGEKVGQITLVKALSSQPSTAPQKDGLGENQFSAYTLYDAGASYLPGFEPQPVFSF